MITLATIVGAVLLVVLQSTWLYGAAPGGVTLDLALLLVLLSAWQGGVRRGTALGLWCGALLGSLTGDLLLFATLYGTLGWAAATLFKRRGLATAVGVGAVSAAWLQGLGWLLGRLTPAAATLPWSMLWHGLALGLLVHTARRCRRKEGGVEWTPDWATPA